MSKASISLVACGVGIIALGLSRPAAAQNIVNGNFDNSVDNVLPFVAGVKTITTGGSATNDLPSWTVTNGTVGLVRNYSSPFNLLGWQPQSGQYSLDLSGINPGTISQAVTNLTAGQTYRVSFWMAGNPLGGPGQKMTVSFGDGVFRPFQFDGTSTRTNMGWQEFSFTSVYNSAVSTNKNLIFAADPGNGPIGPALDNVRITAVTPEAGGLMNLAGALLAPALGVVVTRRRKHKGRAA